MHWKKLVMKLEWLLVELSNLQPDGAAHSRMLRPAEDAEDAADQWIRRFVRSEKLAAPATPEVIDLLLVRASYGLTLAKLLPLAEEELSLEQSMRLVQLLMIDCWRHCFRQKWLGQVAPEPELAFAA